MPSREKLDLLLPASYLKYVFSDIARILLEILVTGISHIAKVHGSTITANVCCTLTNPKTYFTLIFVTHTNSASVISKKTLPS